MENNFRNLVAFWDDNLVESHVGHEVSLVIEYFKNKNINEISYIDVGANVGKYYEILSKNFIIKKVVMVEPHPGLYDYLVSKFPKFETHNFAISDVNGESFFDVSAAEYYSQKENDNLDGLNLGLSKLSNVGGSIKVKTVSGHDFLKNYIGDTLHEIDFIKIDTENVDYKILKSMKDIIKYSPKKPFIVMEHNYHNDMSTEDAKKIYEDFLVECNYEGLDFESLHSNVYLIPKN